MMRWRYLPLAIIAALCGLFVISLGLETNLHTPASSRMEKSLPDFSLPALGEEDNPLTSQELATAGTPVVLNFFASWCLTCHIEHPTLKAIAEEEQIPVYGIAWRDQPHETIAWLEKMGNFYTRVGSDNANGAAVKFGLTGVPETYVIDANGRIAGVHRGPVTDKVKDEWLLPLVEELNAEAANAHP